MNKFINHYQCLSPVMNSMIHGRIEESERECISRADVVYSMLCLEQTDDPLCDLFYLPSLFAHKPINRSGHLADAIKPVSGCRLITMQKGVSAQWVSLVKELIEILKKAHHFNEGIMFIGELNKLSGEKDDFSTQYRHQIAQRSVIKEVLDMAEQKLVELMPHMSEWEVDAVAAAGLVEAEMPMAFKTSYERLISLANKTKDVSEDLLCHWCNVTAHLTEEEHKDFMLWTMAGRPEFGGLIS